MVSGLTERLGRFLSIDGVSVVAVISRDGFVIDSAGCTNIDLDSLGLMVATADEEVFQAQTLIELDYRRNQLLRDDKKKVLMGQVSEEIIALIVDESKAPDWIYSHIKSNLDQLADILVPSDRRKTGKKKIYRYASNSKTGGYSELKQAPSKAEPDVSDFTLDSRELNELVQLSTDLFSVVRESSTLSASDSMYSRFLHLLNGLHCMVQNEKKNNINNSELVDIVFKLQNILLDSTSNYYKMLALTEQAEGELVKKHFGLFKDIYSLDEHIDPDYSCVLKISKAYLVLRSPGRRWLYDSKHAIGTKGREVARQVAHHEWIKKGKTFASQSVTENLKNNLNSDLLKKLGDRGSHTLRSIVGGVKRLYSDLKSKK